VERAKKLSFKQIYDLIDDLGELGLIQFADTIENDAFIGGKKLVGADIAGDI
jgi:hypothetical protein